MTFSLYNPLSLKLRFLYFFPGKFVKYTSVYKIIFTILFFPF